MFLLRSARRSLYRDEFRRPAPLGLDGVSKEVLVCTDSVRRALHRKLSRYASRSRDSSIVRSRSRPAGMSDIGARSSF